jgi:MmeI, target recognition domain
MTILASTICSETREYLPTAVFPGRTGTTNQAFALYDAPLWNLALIASRLHLVWIATVCGKLETRYRYSNTLGWNTFPVPTLTEKNKADLTRCAEDILIVREAHFPATIADLYGDTAALKVWSADFGQIAELLESLGWKISSTDYFGQLDACRLVVNVYKHGKGKSLDDLKQKYPDYLEDPFSGSGGAFSDVEHRDHTHLKVTKDQFQAFSDAIVAFWQAVPENIFESQVKDVPDWFGKALLKDRTGQPQGKTE